MRPLIILGVILHFLIFIPIASADVCSYDGMGEYFMSDFETPDIAKQRAKMRAQQNVLEKAGVYVESFTKTINSQIREVRTTSCHSQQKN